jgi:hypothetical protein
MENFKFRNHIPALSRSDSLGTLISKFLDPQVDLSPAALDNHAMGTVFEELVRRFNEENNEEAGEHWTPRDAVRLMTTLMFRPIAALVKSGTYLLYDDACGTGGGLWAGGGDPPPWPGDQPGNLRGLQGRHAAQRGGRTRRQDHGWRRMVDAVARCLCGDDV